MALSVHAHTCIPFSVHCFLFGIGKSRSFFFLSTEIYRMVAVGLIYLRQAEITGMLIINDSIVSIEALATKLLWPNFPPLPNYRIDNTNVAFILGFLQHIVLVVHHRARLETK